MKPSFKRLGISFFLLCPVLTLAVLMGTRNFSLKLIVKESLFGIAILTVLLILACRILSKTGKKTAFFLLLPFYGILFLKIFTVSTFFNFPGNAVLYTVFETNLAESSDFLHSYIRWYALLLPVAYLVLLYMIPLSEFRFRNNGKVLFICCLCAAIMIRFYERSLVITVCETYADYKSFSNGVARDITKQESAYFSNVTNTDNEAVYVVIIGESTNRRNMRHYGYYRNTNPYTEKIKDELHLFSNVVSPHTQTVFSLNKILSMADFAHPDQYRLGTVLQLANGAGFETYWLSNQNPIGAYESLVSLYAKASKNTFYTWGTYDHSDRYDEVLLPKFREILKQKPAKKMIFLHLLGTHISYDKRYPGDFRHFSGIPQTRFPSHEAFQMINEYDNAVRYNDSIVNEVINSARSLKKNSYVMYFSDHGEEVFHSLDYFGHHEDIATDAMFEIPFIVWTSETYKEKSTIDFTHQLDRKYNLEDFIYSFSELSRIDFDEFKPSRSIFNIGFVPKKRLILNGIDYDERKKTE